MRAGDLEKSDQGARESDQTSLHSYLLPIPRSRESGVLPKEGHCGVAAAPLKETWVATPLVLLRRSAVPVWGRDYSRMGDVVLKMAMIEWMYKAR